MGLEIDFSTRGWVGTAKKPRPFPRTPCSHHSLCSRHPPLPTRTGDSPRSRGSCTDSTHPVPPTCQLRLTPAHCQKKRACWLSASQLS
ncbi:hypothetical protein OIU79_002127 [Salix purpurea]|uniref:Uncharacterized protein n=1 Tax=Salix purpurea TaxID=77065 RepID=A0A9Q0URF0_SALPP|nr:hypothetical protein OIU79_002127 [Salix purpurea]